ncbi:hypothetical protein BHF71_00905 [Vulcanibacillus modesticaldus]|uniref:Transporter n=1 Tax=Vulcanibacillus modesticaldus TaxID=337097 RepID=A0A1D2YVV1_9BACI|nr:TolC family protein [Vulcanibacillus modesticaldus]OEF99766.1 hypothetical protein BHF71_00905 [Vulcanibacillus modesticaldus]
MRGTLKFVGLGLLIVFFSFPMYLQAEERGLQIFFRSDAIIDDQVELVVEDTDQVDQLKEDDDQSAESQPLRLNILDGISFEEAYQLALLNSIDIKKAEYDLEQAKMQFEEVEDLKDLEPTDEIPYVDSMGNILMVRSPETKLQMKINKEITYYQAKNAIDLAEKRIKLEKQNLYHQLTDSMISYTKALEGIQLAEQNLKRAEHFYRTTKEQFAQGLVAKTSVLDSEIALSQAKNGLESAKLQLHTAKESLLVLLGIKDFDGFEVEQIKPEFLDTKITTEQMDSLLSFAFENRIDYLIKQDQVNFEKKRYEIYDEHYSYYGNKEDKIRAQEIVYQKEKLNLLALERSMYLQIYQALVGLNQASDQLVSLEKSVQQAEESLHITQLRYEAGLGTIYEVLSAQTALTQAENNLLDGKYQIMSVKNNLEKVLGGTIEDYQEFITSNQTK